MRPSIPEAVLSAHFKTAVAGFKMPVPSWMQGWTAGR
jgi:hypothetical protein